MAIFDGGQKELGGVPVLRQEFPYGPGELFSPWTVLVRDYSAAPWVSETSPGTSARLPDLDEATNPPDVGTIKNGHPSAAFQPVGTADLLSSPSTIEGLLLSILGDGVTCTGYTIEVVCQFLSLGADGNYYDEPLIVGSAGGNLSLSVSASGIRFTANDSAGTAVSTGRVPVITNTWYRVQAQWTGTEIRVRVDNGTWVTQALTSFWAADFGGSFMLVGRNYDGTKSLNGEVLELGASNLVLSDAFLSAHDAYAVARYALGNGVLYDVAPSTDTVAQTDSIARNVEYGRVLGADTAANTDSVLRNTEYGRVPSTDTQANADSITTERLRLIDSTGTDTQAGTDSGATSTEYGRVPATDAATNADSILSAGDYARAPATDAAANTDSVLRTGDYGRVPATDTAAQTDSITIAFFRTISVTGTDTVAVTDAMTRELQADRSVSDAAAPADSITATRFATFDTSSSDSTTTSDSIAAGFEFARAPATDTVAQTDSVTTALFRVISTTSATDAQAVTDSLAIAADYTRPATDTQANADSILRTAEYGRVGATDAQGNTDSATPELFSAAETVANDTVASSDSGIVSIEAARLVGDAAAASDAITTTLLRLYDSSGADTATTTDSAIRGAEYGRALTDTQASTDSGTIAVFGTIAITLSDAQSITDALANEATYARAPATDAQAVTDSIVVSREYAVIGTDTVAGADSILRTAEYARLPQDALSGTDSAIRSVEAQRALQDAATLTESGIRDLLAERGQTDTGGITDGTSSANQIDRAASDALTVTESVDTASGGVRDVSVNDTVAATESLARWVDYHRPANDVGIPLDAFTRENVLERDGLSDAATTTDQASAGITYGASDIDFDEGAGLVATDFVLVSLTIGRVLADVARPTDDHHVGTNVFPILGGKLKQTHAARGRVK